MQKFITHLHAYVCMCDLKFTPRICAISDMVVSRNLMSDSDTFRCIGWEIQNKTQIWWLACSSKMKNRKRGVCLPFECWRVAEMILINFYTLYLQKGVFVKFAVLPPVLIMFVAFLSLSFFPWSSMLYQPRYSSFLHKCTFVCTHLSPLLKCNFHSIKPDIPVCIQFYPLRSGKMKWNRTSFAPLAKEMSFKNAKHPPEETERIVESCAVRMYYSFFIWFCALLISTISYQQAIKSNENGLTYSKMIRSVSEWHATIDGASRHSTNAVFIWLCVCVYVFRGE